MNKQQAGNERRRLEALKLWESRRAEVEWLYNVQEFSQEAMGVYFGITLRGMQNAMKRLGIKSRSRGNAGERNGRYKDGSQSRLYRVMVEKDKCRKCGTTDNLGIHHKNDDHYDNRIENLEVLCNPCHMSETKKKWWKAKKEGKPLPKSNGPVGWAK